MAETKTNTTPTKPMAFKSSGTKVDRVTLFTIDDKEYTVPKKPRMNTTIKFLDEMRKTGNEMFAALRLLEDMLGSEAYNELLEWDDMTDELLGKIIEQCVSLATGAVEEQRGKSSAG